MKFLFNVLLVFPLSVLCQGKGVHFVEGLSWNEIKARALAENKSIFVDCYTTWCGPCKFMAQRIFPLYEVGRVLNDKYICVSVQMDSTKKDNDTIKHWYADAQSMAKEYKINAYPSFLFFEPDGRPLHKIVGAARDSIEFLAMIRDAQKESKQYFTLMTHYKEHMDDSLFLYDAFVAATKVDDQENATKIGNAYIDCVKNPFALRNIEVIWSVTYSSHDKGFEFFLHHSAEVDTALGVNTADRVLMNIIRKEEIEPVVKNDVFFVDWKKIYNNLQRKYPKQAEWAVLSAQVEYYKSKGMWKEYGQSLVEYVDKYGDLGGPTTYNNSAWFAFLHCDDSTVLTRALVWSRRTILKQPNSGALLDTYASLLYKMGDIKEAISWEQKAISLMAQGKNDYWVESYTRTMQRMQKGERIWEGQK